MDSTCSDLRSPADPEPSCTSCRSKWIFAHAGKTCSPSLSMRWSRWWRWGGQDEVSNLLKTHLGSWFDDLDPFCRLAHSDPPQPWPSPPKGRLAPNLLHRPPTCCSALWTSCLTDTHITTPSRRYSENIHTSCKSRGEAIIWAGQGPEIGEDMVARCGWDLLAGHLDVWLGQKHASIWPHTAPESLPHPI